MRDVIDKVFYKQRYDLLALICGSIMLAFTIRGLASYMQAVLLAKIGNNLVARYQQRMFDHLMRLGVSYFTATRSPTSGCSASWWFRTRCFRQSLSLSRRH